MSLVLHVVQKRNSHRSCEGLQCLSRGSSTRSDLYSARYTFCNIGYWPRLFSPIRRMPHLVASYENCVFLMIWIFFMYTSEYMFLSWTHEGRTTIFKVHSERWRFFSYYKPHFHFICLTRRIECKWIKNKHNINIMNCDLGCICVEWITNKTLTNMLCACTFRNCCKQYCWSTL